MSPSPLLAKAAFLRENLLLRNRGKRGVSGEQGEGVEEWKIKRAWHENVMRIVMPVGVM